MSSQTHRLRTRLLTLPTALLACAALLVTTACEQKRAEAPGPGRLAGTVMLLTTPGTDTTPAVETAVARARVALAGTDRIARTDSTGAFSFDGVAPGRWELFVEAEGAAPITKSDLVVSADATTDVGSLRLYPKEDEVPDSDSVGTLMGKAYLAGWPPTTAIEVVAVTGAQTFRGRTNSLGRFVIEQLPVGEYDLFIRTDTPGFSAETLKVEVRAGMNSVAQEILLTATDKLARLPSQEETPAAERGAEGIFGAIILRESSAMQRECFSDAAVTLDGPPTRVSGLSGSGQFTFQAIGTGTYTLTLESPMIALVEPVTIELREGMSTSIYVEARIRPDAPGDRLARARAAEGGAPLTSPLPLAAEPTDGETATLVGRVVLATPNLLGATIVSLAGTPFNGTPGSDGAFRLEGIPPGGYELSVAAPEHLPYGPFPIEMLEPGTYDVGEIVLEPDIERPRVIASTPSNGSRDISVDYVVPFHVEFDQDMDMASVKAAVSVSPAATFRLFMGRESPRSTERLLYGELYGVKVSQPLDHRVTYRIAVATSATNLKGIGLAAPFSITFTTSAPAIVDTFPRPGTSGNVISVNEPMLIFCNAPIDASSIDERLVTVRPATGGSDPLVRVTTDAETGWGILEVSYPFDINTQYRVRVNSRLRTLSGKGFSNLPYSFSFKTGEVRTRSMDQVSSGGRRRHRDSGSGVYPVPRSGP